MNPIPRFWAGLLLGCLATVCCAQLTLDKMPRYDRYSRLRSQISGSVVRGSLNVTWAPDGKSFTYNRDGKDWRYTLSTGKAEQTDKPEPPRQPDRRRRRGPDRGRQFDTAASHDGKLEAVSKDRNVVIQSRGGASSAQVTTDGSAESRIKYGIASWVYGEELGVRDAMWWSPDDKKLAFYKFDEKDVKDYFIAYDQTKIQDTLNQEPYPKAGAPNPKASLMIYDLASRTTVTVDSDFDSGFGPGLGEYVYGVRWSDDGKNLYYNRTNRKQKIMEWCAADPATGKSRMIIRESQPQSWAENSPAIRWLKGNDKLIWSSERNGFKNLYLYDANGREINPITQGQFDVDSVQEVDEKGKWVYYTARDGANPYLVQLHRAKLDGSKDERLTDPSLSHTVTIAPDFKHFVDVQEKADIPPTTVLRAASGKQLAVLAESNLDKFNALGLRKTERFTYTAADGKTTLYGSIQFPSDFDPSKKYPLIVGVYAGPQSGGGPERFSTPDPITEMGFLVANFEGRGTNGRGKVFRDALYQKLGIVEIDDQAAGVKYLRERPYVDGKRVGIQGTSYGGYSTVMCLLRYPDVFQVGCANSSVTDWHNYDSVYTERYEGLPDEGENKAGYDAGSAMTYAGNLAGRLMLYFGTADNNVHPSNTMQLVQALNQAGKRFDMMVGPDLGHTAISQNRMWEYFVQYLILDADKDPLKVAWGRRKKMKEASNRI